MGKRQVGNVVSLGQATQSCYLVGEHASNVVADEVLACRVGAEPFVLNNSEQPLAHLREFLPQDGRAQGDANELAWVVKEGHAVRGVRIPEHEAAQAGSEVLPGVPARVRAEMGEAVG